MSEEQTTIYLDAVFAKAVTIREGATRTADELNEQFIIDAGDLLDLPDPTFPMNMDANEYSVYLTEEASNLETQLSNAGYTVLWNDGFVIYKDLTEDEAKYVLSDEF